MKYYKISEELLNLIYMIAIDAYGNCDLHQLLLKCGQLAVYMKDFKEEEV